MDTDADLGWTEDYSSGAARCRGPSVRIRARAIRVYVARGSFISWKVLMSLSVLPLPCDPYHLVAHPDRHPDSIPVSSWAANRGIPTLNSQS